MTNQIESLMPKIVSRGLLSLREKAILPRLVNSSFSQEAARHGEHITVPISAPIEVQDVQPSHTPPEPEGVSVHHHTIKLDKWKRASFYLTDKEMMQIDAQEQFLPLQMAEAIQALATAVNSSIFDLYPKAGHVIGTPGVTPFSVPNKRAVPLKGVDVAIEARRILNHSHAPKIGRFGVLDFDAEAQAIALPEFLDASRSGSNAIAMEGEIGRRFGMDWFSVDKVAQAPDALTVLKVAEVAAAGSDHFTVIADIRGNQGLPLPGMVFSIDDLGDFGFLINDVVEESANRFELFITRPLTDQLPVNTKLVLHRNVPVNLVMHRDAVALAMRPLAHTGLETGAGAHMMSVTDPETGLSLRLEVSRQYKQTVWEFDILWGVDMVRPEWAISLIG